MPLVLLPGITTSQVSCWDDVFRARHVEVTAPPIKLVMMFPTAETILRDGYCQQVGEPRLGSSTQ